jgi:hypothetical protein
VYHNLPANNVIVHSNFPPILYVNEVIVLSTKKSRKKNAKSVRTSAFFPFGFRPFEFEFERGPFEFEFGRRPFEFEFESPFFRRGFRDF